MEKKGKQDGEEDISDLPILRRTISTYQPLRTFYPPRTSQNGGSTARNTRMAIGTITDGCTSARGSTLPRRDTSIAPDFIPASRLLGTSSNGRNTLQREESSFQRIRREIRLLVGAMTRLLLLLRRTEISTEQSMLLEEILDTSFMESKWREICSILCQGRNRELDISRLTSSPALSIGSNPFMNQIESLFSPVQQESGRRSLYGRFSPIINESPISDLSEDENSPRESL